MAVKITGYYKLPNEIEPQLIEFDKVFNISFMQNFILVPDSFKGTLSAIEVCNIMKSSIKNLYKNADNNIAKVRQVNGTAVIGKDM